MVEVDVGVAQAVAQAMVDVQMNQESKGDMFWYKATARIDLGRPQNAPSRRD